MRISKGLVAALVAGAAVSNVFCSSAFAETITRENLSRKFLDYCVFTQYRVDGIDRNSMINKCQCAQKAALESMEGDAFEQPSRSKLTGDQEKAIKAGIAACFAKK
ncbi:hypothetical protein [Oryzibacter oryziterrae]|uniref:hypothetical protein n=1 Tax=Oryzibacter oryziterrae TaxID=2766474 RepID=UPI001F3C662A|nr:hypothetical protein [Oryzibacter oryziterrae]